MEQSRSLNDESIVQAVGRMLGYGRSGANVKAIIGDAVEMAVEDGLVESRNGLYVVPDRRD